MRKDIFLSLGNSSWHCLNCALPNVTAFLDLDCHQTRFNSLNNLTSAESEQVDLVNFQPNPRCCSSPKRDQSENKQKRHYRRPVTFHIANFQSINNKKADLLNFIDAEKPDIIAGCETWLNSYISSSEIFPSDYNVYRSDRIGSSHGGALIAIKTEFTCEQLETSKDLEAVFIKVNTQKGKPALIVGSVYRPTNRDINYTTSLCTTIEKIQRRRKKAVYG
jgi:hypothetical protein